MMMKNITGIVTACIVSGLCGCHSAHKATAKDAHIVQERTDAFRTYQFAAGISAYGESSFMYQRDGSKQFAVHLKEPVVISVAAKPEKWGFFQFPIIMKRDDGSIAVKWNLNADAIEAYGNHVFGGAVSRDGGKSWQLADLHENGNEMLLPNGDKIAILTPKPLKTDEMQLPKAIGTGIDTYTRSSYSYYKLDEVPESRKGVFQKRLRKGATEWQDEQAALYDPRAARYSSRGLFPVLFWGDIHVASDQALYAGIYPGFYIKDDGMVDPQSGSFFYRSADNGHSWTIQGRVPYIPDMNLDTVATKRMGFTEPAFTILQDGSFICVLRTTDGLGIGPMYQSRSTDMGKTWSKPTVITPSGVLPRLLRLDNGVTVLSSGRPGVQLRFSKDKEGMQWSDPFEMLPFKHKNDQVSCGYTGLIATGPDRFLVVYSDFNFKNEAGEIRKAIKVREVIVTPQ